MKKLLLLITSIFSFISVYSWSVTLSGATAVQQNQVYSYSVSGIHQSRPGTKATWTITNGYFSLGDGTTKTSITRDVDINYVDVIWNKTGTGKLSYSYKDGSSEAFEGYLYITIDGSSGGNPNDGEEGGLFNVPKYIYSGDIIKVGLTSKAHEVFYAESFLFNENYFSVVSKNNRYIELKAKISSSSYPVTLRMFEKKNNTDKWDKEHIWETTIIQPPTFMFYNNIICLNQNFAYSIEAQRHPSNGKSPIFEWNINKNLEIVSGQNTSQITLKGISNGLTSITAKVIYPDRTFSKNFNVWVGAPANIRNIDGLEPVHRPLMSYALKAISYEDKSITKFTWAVTGKAEFAGIPNDERKQIGGILTGTVPFTGTGSFDVRVFGENKCGRTNTLSKHGFIEGWGYGGNTEFLPPRPGGGNGFLKSLSTTEKEDIRVYSFSTGQTVYQEKKAVNFNIENTMLKSGIYIIESTDESGNITRNKVMKK